MGSRGTAGRYWERVKAMTPLGRRMRGGGIIDTTEAQMPEGVITATSSQPQPFTVCWRAEAWTCVSQLF